MIKTRLSLKASIKVVCSLVLVSLMSANLSARELRLASGVPPLHPGHTPLYTEFKDLIAEYSSGSLSGKLLGTEVTTLGNMRASIQSGVVEVGLFLPAYFPADLPNFNLIGDMSMLGSDANATAAAVTEYMLTCDDCAAEFSKLGAVYTSTCANPYSLLSRKAVTSVDDLEGMRIRVATPQHARWVESVGGKPVSLATGEVFEALSQGIVDGTIASTSDLVAFNLGEVVSHITVLDLGTFHSISNHTIKDSVWAALSEKEREAVLRASFRSNVLMARRWSEQADEGRQIAKDKGIPLLEPEQELQALTRQFKDGDIEGAASSVEERFGISSAEGKIARFQALVSKWEGLMESTDGSVDAIVSLYESEILPRVDLKAYGH